MLPYVKMVHVAYNDFNRNALFIDEGNGVILWTRIINMLKSNQSKASFLLEFLKETSMEGLMRQTRVMKNLLKEGDWND